MDWLAWIFLESLPALGVALGLTLFGLLAYWRRGGSRRPLLIGLAAAAALLVVQQVVTTSRERADRILTRIERELVAGQTTALAASLAPDFHAAQMDRTAFTTYAQRKLETVRVMTIRRGELTITGAAAEQFVAEVGYQTTVALREFGAQLVPSRWRITFGRRAGAWQIITIDPPSIAGQQFDDWNISP